MLHSREQHIEHLSLAKTQPDQHFAAWVEAHGRHYANDAVEYARRLGIWLENLEFALAYNAKHRSHWIGLNAMADLTQSEYRQKYLGFDNSARLAKQARNTASTSFMYADVDESNLPVSIDWRTKGAVSDVKNQAQCGERKQIVRNPSHFPLPIFPDFHLSLMQALAGHSAPLDQLRESTPLSLAS